MQDYLRSRRMAEALNTLGLRALIALVALGWFVLLWGLSVPSVAAGLSLGLLGQMALTRYRQENVARRQDALRRRLGGELALEELAMLPEDRAHARAAMLLARRWPGLVTERTTAEGAVCRLHGEALLVVCPAMTAGDELSAGQALRIAQACRRAGAARGVVCLMGRCGREASAWAETGPVPLRMISRETMLALGGEAQPVTDAQLAALGARKKRSAPAGWTRSVLLPEKAKRYMLYGLALMLLYVATGLKYYPAPGTVCLVLGTLCRCVRQGEEGL